MPGKASERGRGRGSERRRAGSERLEGRFIANQKGFGFIVPEKSDDGRLLEDFFVPPDETEGAMSGDRVEFEVTHRRGRVAASVTRIVLRARERVVGVVRRQGGGLVVEVSDENLSALPVGLGTDTALEGAMVVARYVRYPRGDDPGAGEIVATLGSPSDAGIEIDVAIETQGLRRDFPAAVIAEAESVPRDVPERDTSGRLDLRRLPFVTIDGEDARDFDDAVAVEQGEGGSLRLWVAIADVAHYVRPGSALDAEARARGTSVYFPGRVLPMLPEALSNGICSLNPRVDRLALAVMMPFGVRGHEGAAEFHEVVFRSHARLTYGEVQRMLDDPTSPTPVARGDIEAMQRLAIHIMARRTERGSLDLEIPEAYVKLDEERRPLAILRRERLFAHRLIEEFMIAANEAVARFFSGRGLPSVYRIHEPPDPEDVDAFVRLARNLGAPPPRGPLNSPKALALFAHGLAGHRAAATLQRALLRSLKEARYSVDNRGHYGLASTDYLHFTSPIRRYPDLAVHRELKRALASAATSRGEGAKGRTSRDELVAIADESSKLERKAVAAERDVEALHKAMLMASRIGEVFEGTVTTVKAFGLFVDLDEPFVGGLIATDTLGADSWGYDAERESLVASRSGRSFSVGDRVRVRVESVNVARRHIDFSLVAVGRR